MVSRVAIIAAFSCLVLTSTAAAQPPAPPLPAQQVELTRLQGTVVDDQGRPVADATVYCFMKTSNSLSSQPDRLTDEKGVFWLSVPQGAGVTLVLRARHDKAVTEKALVVSGDQLKGPITITVSPKFARPYRVRVTDAERKPVAKAKIELKYATGGFEVFTDWNTRPIRAAGGTTGDEGVFESPACLALDGSYRLEVQGEGFLSERTSLKPMPKTGALDFGTVILRRMTPLAGLVVDTGGTPVAGARVSHSDARQRVQATSDESGKFELQAAFAPPGFLFVEKAGYRFYGQPCDKPEALKITLRRRDEPSGQKMTTLPRVMTSAERKALAEQLFEPAFKQAQAKQGDDERVRLLEILAKIDPGRLLEELDRRPLKSSWSDSYLRRSVAKRFMAESPDEARGLMESIKNADARCYGYIDLCDSLPDNKRAEKIELLNQTLTHSTAVTENDHRVLHIGHVARRLWALGEKDRAAQLLRDGEAIAKELPTAAWAGYARGAFAEDLALIDLPAALTLMKDLKDPNEFDRHHGNLAVKLARTNPVEAENVYNILLKLKSPNQVLHRNFDAIRLCYWLAPVDLSRAQRIAETIKEPDFKARAYGMMAEAMAKEKPDKALRLLDQSFDILAQLVATGGGGFGSFWSAAGMAGLQLPVAEQMDASLVPEFFWRTISLHVPSARSEFDDLMERDSNALGTLAMVLARYDRGLAMTFANRAQSIPRSTGFTYGRDNVLIALALLDPPRAVASVEQNGNDRWLELSRNVVINMLMAKDEEAWRMIRRTMSMNFTDSDEQ